MESLFETIANATKPEYVCQSIGSYTRERMDDMESREHCDILDRCPEGVDNCEECRKLANQAEEEEE
jgi:hypothetical protein